MFFMEDSRRSSTNLSNLVSLARNRPRILKPVFCKNNQPTKHTLHALHVSLFGIFLLRSTKCLLITSSTKCRSKHLLLTYFFLCANIFIQSVLSCMFGVAFAAIDSSLCSLTLSSELTPHQHSSTIEPVSPCLGLSNPHRHKALPSQPLMPGLESHLNSNMA